MQVLRVVVGAACMLALAGAQQTPEASDPRTHLDLTVPARPRPPPTQKINLSSGSSSFDGASPAPPLEVGQESSSGSLHEDGLTVPSPSPLPTSISASPVVPSASPEPSSVTPPPVVTAQSSSKPNTPQPSTTATESPTPSHSASPETTTPAWEVPLPSSPTPSANSSAPSVKFHPHSDDDDDFSPPPVTRWPTTRPVPGPRPKPPTPTHAPEPEEPESPPPPSKTMAPPPVSTFNPTPIRARGQPCGNEATGPLECRPDEYCQPWNPSFYQCRSMTSAKCGTQVVGVDFEGDDIMTVPVLLPEQCCDLCAITESCKTYTFVNYNPDGQARCYLKRGLGQLAKKADAVSGVVTKCSVLIHKDAPGNDMLSQYGLTFDQCCDKCAATGGCKGFSYVYDTKGCYLKSDIDARTVNNGVSMGVLLA